MHLKLRKASSNLCYDMNLPLSRAAATVRPSETNTGIKFLVNGLNLINRCEKYEAFLMSTTTTARIDVIFVETERE